MKFLCSNHRKQLIQSPTRAVECWNQWLDTGSNLIEQQNWKRASSYFGCCYEVAEWLLAQPELLQNESELTYVDRYMVAGHHLAECFGRIGRHDVELHYLLTVHRCLMNYVMSQEHKYWSLKNNLEISLLMLSRFTQLQGQFKGYEDCYLETEKHITQLKSQLN